MRALISKNTFGGVGVTYSILEMGFVLDGGC